MPERRDSVAPHPAKGHALKYGLLISFFVEADEEGVAMSEGRGSEVSCRTEQMGCKLIVAGRVVLHVEGEDLFPFGDYDCGRTFCQFQGFFPPFLLFSCVGSFFHFKLMLLKEPLSFGATGSPAAMVHPVDLPCHALPSLWLNTLAFLARSNWPIPECPL